MQVEHLRQLGRCYVDEILTGGRMDLIDDHFAADFINHNPFFNTAPDLNGFKQYVQLLHTVFTDLTFQLADLVAEPGKLALRISGRGIHTGSAMGIAPTHKPVSIQTITILHFREDRVAARWNMTNDIEMMTDLGLL